jgi:DnaK suppressor protein
MDQKKLKALREQLEHRKTEILDAFTKNKTYGKEADEDGAQDIADKATNSYTKEFLFSLSNSEREMLQELDAALSRLDGGRFGVCVACEEAIERRRIEAVPWTRHCLACQQKMEQGLL